MNRRFFVSGSAALLAAGCAQRTACCDALRVGVTRHFNGFDPYEHPFAEIAALSWICGSGLTSTRGMRLATTIGARSTTLQYRLRSGVRWHDGRPLRATDVVRCFHRLVRANIVWSVTPPYANVADIDAVDDLTFRVRLRQHDDEFVRLFFSGYGALPLPLLRSDGDLLIGTGAFKMLRSSPAGASYVRVLPDGGPLHLNVVYYDDDNSAAVALRSREVDAIVPIARTAVTNDRFNIVRRDMGSIFVIANVERLRSKEMRGAVLGAIDAAGIAERIYDSAATDDLLPGVPVPVPAQHGDPLPRQLVLCYAAGSVAGRVAAMLVENYEHLGVAVDARQSAYETFEARLRSGDFDIALYGGQFAVTDDAADFFRCGLRAPAGGNLTRLCDRGLDRAFANQDRRAIATLLSNQSVLRVIAPYYEVAAFSSRVSGIGAPEAFTPWFGSVGAWKIS